MLFLNVNRWRDEQFRIPSSVPSNVSSALNGMQDNNLAVSQDCEADPCNCTGDDGN